MSSYACSLCGILKPLSAFHKDASSVRKHCSQCKECRKLGSKKAYTRIKSDPKLIERSKLWQKKYYSSKKPYIRKYSKKKEFIQYFGGKCSICAYGDCLAALEFHHLNPEEKEFNLAKVAISEDSWDKCVEEASKCILVCNRCHREIHNLPRENEYEKVLNENKLQKKESSSFGVSGI
jgi:hypothetical protein